MRIFTKHIILAGALILFSAHCLAAPAAVSAPAVQGQQTLTFTGTQTEYDLDDYAPAGTPLGLPFEVEVNGTSPLHQSGTSGYVQLIGSSKADKIKVNGVDKWVYRTDVSNLGVSLTAKLPNDDTEYELLNGSSPSPVSLGKIIDSGWKYHFILRMTFIKIADIEPETNIPTEMNLPQLQFILHHTGDKSQDINDGTIETFNLHYKTQKPIVIQVSEKLKTEGSEIKGDPGIGTITNDNAMPVGMALGKAINTTAVVHFNDDTPKISKLDNPHPDAVQVSLVNANCHDITDVKNNTFNVCGIPNIEGIGYTLFAHPQYKDTNDDAAANADFQNKQITLKVTLQFYKTGYVNPGISISKIPDLGKLKLQVLSMNPDLALGRFATDKPMSFTSTNDKDIDIKGLGCD